MEPIIFEVSNFILLGHTIIIIYTRPTKKYSSIMVLCHYITWARFCLHIQYIILQSCMNKIIKVTSALVISIFGSFFYRSTPIGLREKITLPVNVKYDYRRQYRRLILVDLRGRKITFLWKYKLVTKEYYIIPKANVAFLNRYNVRLNKKNCGIKKEESLTSINNMLQWPIPHYSYYFYYLSFKFFGFLISRVNCLIFIRKKQQHSPDCGI